MSTTAKRTRQVIADQAGRSIEQADDELHLQQDLNLDSLDRYELTMALEDEFGVRITDAEVDPLNTVGQIVALVERKLEGGAS